jgi:branched-chain amino acid transport system permease protein
VRRVLGERAWYAVVFVLAAAAGLLWLPAWLQATVDLGLIYAMGAISLNLVTGVAGLPSIGNAAFLAIGAFSVALLAPARNEFWLGLLIGAVVCTAVGALVGLTARRVSGLYLAVSTLALQFLVADGANLWQQHTKHPGGYPVPTPTVLPGVVLTSLRTWYVVLAVALGLVALLASNLLRSRWGRSWLAIRENDVMARSLGIDVARQKLVVFCVSSGILGVAGALLAYFTLVITATTFSLTLAIEFVSMIIIGGLGSVPGSIVGTAIIVAIPQVLQHVGSGTAGSSWWSRNTFNIQTAIFGLIIIAVLVVAPEGLASFGRRLVRGR